MGVYVARRLLWLPFLLFVVSLVTFTLGFYGPGDPARVRLGPRATPEAVETLRQRMGLDRPFAVQYGDYVWSAVRGDLGDSYSFQGRTVSEVIGRKVWISAQLGAAAMLVAVTIGIPLGLLAAYKQGTWVDTALVSFSLFFYATPVFIAAPFLILFFALDRDLGQPLGPCGADVLLAQHLQRAGAGEARHAGDARQPHDQRGHDDVRAEQAAPAGGG